MKQINPLPTWAIWGLLLPLLALNIWVALQILNYLQSFFTIFATATLFSFILDYPVRLLQRFRLPRTGAVLIILLMVIGLCILLGVTVIPALVGQLNDLITHLPTWIESGSQQLQSLQNWAASRGWSLDLSHWVSQLEERLSTLFQAWSGQILNIFVGTVGRLFDLVLTMVITFYLLLHGDRLWDGVFQWFPADKGKQIRTALRQNFHNYYVGQFSIAALKGAAMTLAFVLIRVPFGLLFGLGVGVLAIFPFGTPLGIAIVSFLAALESIWLGVRVLLVAALIDQGIENLITPQLLGKFTGLNPVWILASLLLGVKLGGLLGLVTAVPLASFIKSMIEQYRVTQDFGRT